MSIETPEEKFVHLHLHTQYSVLDGAIRIKELILRLKELGMSSCAITDHGYMSGIIDFYESCQNAGIRPIIGCEYCILSYGKVTDKNYREGTSHLVLLAENNTGLKNLYKLSSIMFDEGVWISPKRDEGEYRGKSCIDKNILAEHSEGIIVLSGCLKGEIAQKILKNDYKAALEAALEYDKIMGRGNFFLEIQETGIPDQETVNRGLISISKETGIPLVATCDCHYLRREDHIAHDTLIKIKNKLERKEKERTVHSEELYVKSYEEILKDFSYAPDAIENTVKIAKRCNVEIKFGDLHLPQYDVPEGYTTATYFSDLARKGLEKRLKRVPEEKHQAYKDRLEEEIEVITMKGFDGYFLIVWDIVNYAKRKRIHVGQGRGSCACSLAAYALGITEIDPVRFNLLFECFINPERRSMPDFDIDFCPNDMENVIEYVNKRYGSERVCGIVTFNTFKPRDAVRNMCEVSGMPFSDFPGFDESDAVKMINAIPNGPAINSFKDAFDADPSFMDVFWKHRCGLEILEGAKSIVGLTRNVGKRAVGVIIADKPISEYAPLLNKAICSNCICQFEKGAAEKIGLIEFNFFSVKSLAIIDDAIKRIRDSVAPDFDINDVPLDDKEVFDLLQRGETVGMFRLESDGMKSLLRKLRPTVFEDIIAANALYRQGPINSRMLDDFIKRKHGEEKIEYAFPELEEILKETYGVIVYQEQIMQIACVLGGYTLGSADILRRAMGKKDKEEMARQRVIFLEGNENTKGENERLISGVKATGFDVEKAAGILDLMQEVAEHGFNKSHSAAYALIAYQTAYLKAKFPLQYMAALLSLNVGDEHNNGGYANELAMSVYISECKKMGINLLPPDINKCQYDFCAEGENGICFGLRAITWNPGRDGRLEEIVWEREINGPYKSMDDFLKRIDCMSMDPTLVDDLIKVGAFDRLFENRDRLLEIYHEFLKNDLKMTVTDTAKNHLDFNKMSETELLRIEKEVLGFYYSNGFLKQIRVSTDIDKIRVMPDGTHVLVEGEIKELCFREITNLNIIEDLSDTVDVIVDIIIDKQLFRAPLPYPFSKNKRIIVWGVCSKDNNGGGKMSILAERFINPDKVIKDFVYYGNTLDVGDEV